MKPPRDIAIALLAALMLLAGCGSKSTPGPEAVDGFMANYQAAYEKRGRETLLMQVDWPAVPEELRAFTNDYVLPYRGQGKILSMEAVDYEASPNDPQSVEGKAVVPSPEPTHRVVIEFAPEDPYGDPVTSDILVVEREGKVYLCGWAYAE